MFSIGMFSKINKVTTKTLRYYEEMGLLEPEYIDKFTRYRYYTTNQIPKLHKIINLKQMGLSLNEIKEVINNPSEAEEILISKEREVMNVIKNQQYRLLKLRSYLGNLKGEENMKDIIIKELPKVKIASMRKIIKNYEELFQISTDMVSKEMKRLGCVYAEPNYCFNVYHDGEYKESNIDVEICEAVTELKKDTDIFKFKEIDRVPMAVCILHKGAYSNLRESYLYAFKWIEENKYEVIDNPRESYIDGIWNKENEEDWLTEIQIPVKVIS